MHLKLSYIGEYIPQNERWETYSERFEQFVLANGIADEKVVPVFLSVVGSKAYNLLRSLTAPDKPATKSFADIKKILSNHFAPTPIVIAERYSFYKCQQSCDQSVNSYVAQLSQLTEHCEFGGFLNDALRDKFVLGLQSEATQKRLLSEKNLTYQKAIDIAVAMEVAAKDLKEVGSHGTTSSLGATASAVHKVSSASGGKNRCWCCNRTNHTPENCFYKSAQCHACGKTGHIQASKVCKTSRSGKVEKPKFQEKKQTPAGKPRKKFHQSAGVKQMYAESENSASDSDVPIKSVSSNGSSSYSPIMVTIEIENIPLQLELDTGSAVSVISWKTYQDMFSEVPLKDTKVTLKTYTGELIEPKGVIEVTVSYQSVNYPDLQLFVVEHDASPILGCSWLDWPSSKSIEVNKNQKLQDILDSHRELFGSEMGKMKNFKATIVVEDDCQPKFCRPRPVAYALRNKVEAELDRLQKTGVISPVSHSNWGTPIVPVIKRSGDLRICGDFKVTVNQVLKVEQYPLPRIEDIFSQLSGGSSFSKLDLAHAYQQMEIDEASKEFVTINTHKGLFVYNRLPFGIASAPAIYQNAMEQIVQGLPGIQVYLDDILCTGSTYDEHLNNLDKLLSRLEEFGLRLKRNKCEFFKSSITYLGYKIDADGLHATDDKVQAIVNAKIPESVSELRSFLGLLNYYGKFLPMLSTVLQPLNNLLGANVTFKWNKECDSAFKKCKNLITSNRVLTMIYSYQSPLLVTPQVTE